MRARDKLRRAVRRSIIVELDECDSMQRSVAFRIPMEHLGHIMLSWRATLNLSQKERSSYYLRGAG